MTRTCNKCRFAKTDGERLYCHRAPPQAQLEPGVGVHYLFPAVAKESWCGEFRLAWRRLIRGHVTPRA